MDLENLEGELKLNEGDEVFESVLGLFMNFMVFVFLIDMY